MYSNFSKIFIICFLTMLAFGDSARQRVAKNILVINFIIIIYIYIYIYIYISE